MPSGLSYDEPSQTLRLGAGEWKPVTAAVRAYARLRRAPEYTALMARGHVDGCEDVGRGMAEEHSCWRRVANL